MKRPHSSADSFSAADFEMATAQPLYDMTPNPSLQPKGKRLRLLPSAELNRRASSGGNRSVVVQFRKDLSLRSR